jgi:hypothetical protein
LESTNRPTGVPPSQKAVRKDCSFRVHQLLVTTTKIGPVMLSMRPRKKRLTMRPVKLVTRAEGVSWEYHLTYCATVDSGAGGNTARIENCVHLHLQVHLHLHETRSLARSHLRVSRMIADQTTIAPEISLPTCRGNR